MPNSKLKKNSAPSTFPFPLGRGQGEGSLDWAPFAGESKLPQTGSWRYLEPYYENLTPPCSNACLTGEDIVKRLSLIEEGRFREAVENVWQANPFPSITGRVCSRPCEKPCNRKALGGAVSIRATERFLGDMAASRQWLPKMLEKENELPVAVIGSGPAGLSAAFYLKLLGHPVTVFERDKFLGGFLRSGISSDNFPGQILDVEIERLRKLAIKFVTDARIEHELGIKELEGNFRAIVVAVEPDQSSPLKGFSAGESPLNPVVERGPASTRGEPSGLVLGSGGKGDSPALNPYSPFNVKGGDDVNVPVLDCGHCSQDIPAAGESIRCGRETACRISAMILRQDPPELDLLKKRGARPEIAKFKQFNTSYFKFEETHLAMAEEDVLAEARRCFKCGACNLCGNCELFCPDRAVSLSPDGSRYEIDYHYCKGCGICVEECPRAAIHLRPRAS